MTSAPEKYKVRSLKVFSDNEWLYDNAKKYRQVFEESAVTYIYGEFAFFNKLFDEEDWQINVHLKCYDGKGVLLCDQDASQTVKKEDNIVYIRKGWGNPDPGSFWKRGTYRWEAVVDGKSVLVQYFYIESEGKVSADSNPYFNLRSVKLYEGPDKFIPVPERKYLKTFDIASARFIWFEFEAENLVTDKGTWACEIFFNFRNDAGEHKGSDNKMIFVKENDEKISLNGGWGSSNPGSWFKGTYYLEVSFMETMIARIPFYIDTFEEEAEEDYFLTGMQGHLQQGAKGKAGAGKKELSYEEAIHELNELIGLTAIKEKIKDYSEYLKFVKLRAEKGIAEDSTFNLHAVFTGNPGTGKTKVAQTLGKIYKSLGLLSKGHVHEVDREDLIGQYIGHTAPRVKEAIKKARGGILFIDEAYSLARSNEDSRDFGREAIEILLKEMSDGKGDIAIIAAGYPEEMRTFIESNPGLKSRFGMQIHFPDYVPQELLQIADFTSGKRSIIVSSEARSLIYEELVEAYRTRDRSFGNARFVNSVIEEAKMNMGLRLVKMPGISSLSNEQLSTITPEDVQKVFRKRTGIVADIPVEEDLLRETLGRLRGMVGIENIINEIEETVKLVRYYREIGKDVRKVFSLHTVFTGNPGTGKTTVARIIADLYKALGILEKGHLVECDRAALVGTYIGHTAVKTNEAIERAMGGVLFIDEAYSLTQSGVENDFGKEAIEIILKRMEDRRGEFVVIAAGYPDNMQQFLLSNPGLKSRFDKVLHFDDYDMNELILIASYMLSERGMKADEAAVNHLKSYFDYLDKTRDKYFGNAREVRKVIEEAVKNQHLRLAEVPKAQRTPEMINTLTLPDVEEFKPGEIKKKPQLGFSVE
jgi:SpoVK/Ycf46/Vps4 family AAA+-type ATPase